MKKRFVSAISAPALLLLLLFFQGPSLIASPEYFQQTRMEYRGQVEDSRSGDPLSSAYVMLQGTNISTITNSEGEFVLKVAMEFSEAPVQISHLGYQSLTFPSEQFRHGLVSIKLTEIPEVLTEISLLPEEDPRALVREMLLKKKENYGNKPSKMEAFYRETIKKGRRNVSLSEAVINIHKKPYSSSARDEISLIKARKSADYSRLDTLAMKLRGGPFNPLVLDLIKNPDYMFYQEDLENYHFEFDAPTRINDRYLYVVKFEDMNKALPWYFGKFYIDALSKALVKAEFELNVDNKSVASSMFVKKKPGGTKVYPVHIAYKAAYRQQDGKWFFGYGYADMEFLINWKRKLFNSRYKVNSELAITDWTLPSAPLTQKAIFLHPDVVMADDVSGFADLDFWGANNIIEPDKTIDNAIEKIRKNLKD